MKSRQPVHAIFGASHFAALEHLLPSLNGFAYVFMPVTEFEAFGENDTCQAMRVYWSEILARAHWAAATSLIRSHRWLSGLFQAYEDRNLLAFAACARGFLEAVADTNDALNSVPETLAANHTVIKKAVTGRLEQIVVGRELENQLLHFTHGRRPKHGESVPKEQRAKTAADYLFKLKAEHSEVGELYRILCDLVHPAAGSVHCFAQPIGQGGGVQLSQDAEIRSLEWLRDLLGQMGLLLMSLGINVPLLILKVLNELPEPQWHTESVRRFDLEAMPAWQKIKRHLEISQPTRDKP